MGLNTAHRHAAPKPPGCNRGACALALILLLACSTAPCIADDSTDAARQFEESVAPLLARHCLECHGPTSKKGRLDLSRKAAALEGGKTGPAIVAGKADESLAWQYVESDEMPKNRPPLSPQEKQILRAWIDAGAVWSAEAIDPAKYRQDPSSAVNSVRRLTVPEYIETVRSAVGVDIEQDARRILPRDLRADGFSNTAYNLNVDLGHIEAYAKLAEIIAARMDVRAFAAQFAPCQEPTEACFRQVIAGMGKWLLRGPLEEHEVAAFLRVSTAVVSDGGDFTEALRYVVEAMLQSPRFIYRIEQQRGDGERQRVGNYELASRLSYTIWGAPPDKELMRAADAGELAERGRVEQQVRRMLEDPRAVERSSRFIYEWLDLERLNSLRPNRERFPTWDEQLAVDMREETLAFFRHIALEQKRPLSDLLNAQVTFATPRLAAHYGLDPALAAGKVAAGEKPKVPPQRATGGLQALYTFAEGSGDAVRDVSGQGEPTHLKIEDPSAVEWDSGGLRVKGSTLIASAGPPKRLIEALKKANEVTLEAWVTPADVNQSGPARILTLSSGSSQRNFTLGQDGNRFDVRFRTTKVDGNGLPSLASPTGSVETRPIHVVYTRDKGGKAKLYIDGEEKGARDVGGDLSNWDAGFRLALANETTKDRPWQGVLHLAAVYDRALSRDEVRQNRTAGARSGGTLLAQAGTGGIRSRDGLQALYTFGERGGETVRDVSGTGEPIHLTIEKPSAVKWENGGLTIVAPTIIAAAPHSRLMEAVKKSNAVTLEAVITPANAQQKGPARIFTWSSGISQRNFTLGQEADRFEVRFRTTGADANGMPALASPRGSVQLRPLHVVYTRDASGRANLYIDGEHKAGSDVGGNLSNWDGGFRLALGNETSMDRPWQGTLHRIAIYSRALSHDEVRAREEGLLRFDVTSVPGRGGLLTQGSTLTIGGDDASMVTRGLFVLKDFLYSGVEDPPPCVDTTPVPPKPGMSQRTVAMQRIANSSCKGCHSKFEPLAFGLEKLDGIGAYHEVDEHGNTLREDGEVHFPGDERPIPYRSSAELMDLLAASERVKMCITRKATQFALGRPLVETDEPSLDKIHESARQGGGTYASLITAIVMSDLVQTTSTEANP